jgi:chemotaxis signal transduction protein
MNGRAERSTREDGILVCDVGSERYAFRGGDVRHVERAEYVRVDPAEDGRLGTLRLGGLPVPVFALAQVLGRPWTPASGHLEGHVAVTGDRQGLVGWLVDRIARAPHPAADDIAPLPPLVGAPATRWFEGIVRLGGDEIALLLSPQGLGRDATWVPRAEPAVFDLGPGFAGHSSEPIAVVFSTPALPESAARRYALSARQIAAIVQPDDPIAVPGCSPHVLGVTWWRRGVVPVVDFRAASGRPPAAGRRRVIAQCGGDQHGSLIAFSIDAEVMMCRPGADHQQVTSAPCPWFASGMFDVNGDPVALVDLAVLLAGDPQGEPAPA